MAKAVERIFTEIGDNSRVLAARNCPGRPPLSLLDPPFHPSRPICAPRLPHVLAPPARNGHPHPSSVLAARRPPGSTSGGDAPPLSSSPPRAYLGIGCQPPARPSSPTHSPSKISPRAILESRRLTDAGKQRQSLPAPAQRPSQFTPYARREPPPKPRIPIASAPSRQSVPNQSPLHVREKNPSSRTLAAPRLAVSAPRTPWTARFDGSWPSVGSTTTVTCHARFLPLRISAARARVIPEAWNQPKDAHTQFVVQDERQSLGDVDARQTWTPQDPRYSQSSRLQNRETSIAPAATVPAHQRRGPAGTWATRTRPRSMRRNSIAFAVVTATSHVVSRDATPGDAPNRAFP
ncbi:hypothetical protein HETIRDRAFT_453964 [Heterobasidion irregulare TC 32-1]|uniref:Uncharacterized protein n=1 Tax=Heterobasidion irregulare (strain TC 32-1) TaxID=747525 RepID=W4JWN2_HETIT|nr:uncharacterized protein HETIRDRAFT_453964 [Heterobasidion irregulare TC 32-1]ETW77859.1 hypothetical protein HETIRDRAFT_453964 [Heterobasidion irregulare TC 32-1]